jgi:hypothetical protein
MDRRELGPVLTLNQLSRLRSVLRSYERTGNLLTFATVTVKDLLLDIDAENKDSMVLVEALPGYNAATADSGTNEEN